MDLKRTLLLTGLLVAGYFMVLQWDQDYSKSAVPPTATQPFSQPSGAPEDNSVPDVASSSSAEIPAETLSGGPGETQRMVRVSTDTMQLVIDPRGGDIVHASLSRFPREKGSKEPFVLLENAPGKRVFTAASGLVGPAGPEKTGQPRPVYTVEKNSYTMGEDGQLEVDLHLQSGELGITKRFTFFRGKHSVDVSYIVDNDSSAPWQGRFYGQLKRDSSVDPSQELSNTSGMHTYLGGAVRTRQKQYEKIPFDEFPDYDGSGSGLNETVKGGYASIVQHYFVSAWVPDQSQNNIYRTTESGDTHVLTVIQQPLTVAPHARGTLGATLYIGPKNQKELARLAEGLDLTIDYGILWWFAKPLFLLLRFLHSVVGNWGWSIVVLTLLVKSLFYPLSAASYRSMAKMRKVAPKMQSLKERHGDDRQALSQAMIKLYKEEKVNPVGGCLPTLIQMPVFIALYWVLMESVELRQAPWLGWIKDLSQMDSYFILPLVMGASMFAQQLLSPAPPDPTQARVMKMMPVVFTFFFLWFPSGLVLYWVTNNLLSIAQQWYVTRKIEAGG